MRVIWEEARSTPGSQEGLSVILGLMAWSQALTLPIWTWGLWGQVGNTKKDKTQVLVIRR